MISTDLFIVSYFIETRMLVNILIQVPESVFIIIMIIIITTIVFLL
jgi:hypothetical protein